MSKATLTPEGEVTDVLEAAVRGITAPRVPRPPVSWISAAVYVARWRAESEAER